MVIWPEAISAQNSMAAVAAPAPGALGLDPSLELFMQAFDGVCRAQGSPLRGRIAQESEQPFSGFFQAVRHAPARSGDLGITE